MLDPTTKLDEILLMRINACGVYRSVQTEDPLPGLPGQVRDANDSFTTLVSVTEDCTHPLSPGLGDRTEEECAAIGITAELKAPQFRRKSSWE
jgi:hypothetical protein